MFTCVACEEDHETVVPDPWLMLDGETEMEQVGEGGATHEPPEQPYEQL